MQELLFGNIVLNKNKHTQFQISAHTRFFFEYSVNIWNKAVRGCCSERKNKNIFGSLRFGIGSALYCHLAVSGK